MAKETVFGEGVNSITTWMHVTMPASVFEERGTKIDGYIYMSVL